MIKEYLYDTMLHPARITVITVDGETKSAIFYATWRELYVLIENPNIDVEILD